jgi:hypothetical protein
VIIAGLILSFLPFFPLLVEGRDISQEGESLYQEWRMVSLKEFYDYAQFAMVAWLDSTKIIFLFFAVIYPIFIFAIPWLVARGFRNKIGAKRMGK